MIAMALACKPRYLIADDPTIALDVILRLQIFTILGIVRHLLGE
jgi:ABC-type dipeptide/oligopeptide/nickel transport system ATPase component